MPELPEVEVVKNFLKSNFNHKRIQKIKIINKKLRYEIKPSISKYFVNLIITKICRRGKYLILLFNNKFTLLIHLGMTGYFRISNEEKLIKHDHLIFYFESRLLIFNDIRKFGFIKFYKPQEVFHHHTCQQLVLNHFQRNMILIILKIIQKKKLILKIF